LPPSPPTPLPLSTGGEGRQSDPGHAILQQSFALIERELGPHTLPPWAFAVVRRMIHPSADFDFARTLRDSADFATAMRNALRGGAPFVTDTDMVRIGIRTALAEDERVTLACHLNDEETARLAVTAGLTRSAAGIRVAARHHPSPVVVIGK